MTVTLTEDDDGPLSAPLACLPSAAQTLELKKFHDTNPVAAGRDDWSASLRAQQEPTLDDGQEQQQEPSTAELWICRLRAALQETQRNLNLISASYLQLQQQQADRVMSARIQRSVSTQTEERDGTKGSSQPPLIEQQPGNPIDLPTPVPAAASAVLDCQRRYFGDGCPDEMVRLNDAWELAGLHSRQRMAILGRHYRRLYRRHQRLKRKHRRLGRSVRRSRRRFRYIQLQHQILLQSIGRQVDDVASDWAGRLKRLLQATVAEPKGATAPPPLGDDQSSSSLFNPSEEHPRLKGPKRRQETKKSPSSSLLALSIHRWYSALCLKLSWLQTSHRTVVDNFLLFRHP